MLGIFYRNGLSKMPESQKKIIKDILGMPEAFGQKIKKSMFIQGFWSKKSPNVVFFDGVSYKNRSLLALRLGWIIVFA